MQDLRQSKSWADYLKSMGWKVEKVDSQFIYLKKIPIVGYFAKLQRPQKINEKIINFVDSKYHPFKFLIEPSNNLQVKLLKKLNFKISNFPSLPTKTLQINLTKSKEELLKSFSQKTRYNVKLSQKKNIKIIESKNIRQFSKFWRQNFEKKHLPLFSQQKNIIALYKAFEKNSIILLAKKDNQILSGLLILIHDKVAYYMYAATSNIGRSNFAPTLLTWEAILLAKKLGMKTFDFDGIFDERFPVKSWQGFTKFKKSFGGYEIKYPGCFTKNRSIIKI